MSEESGKKKIVKVDKLQEILKKIDENGALAALLKTLFEGNDDGLYQLMLKLVKELKPEQQLRLKDELEKKVQSNAENACDLTAYARWKIREAEEKRKQEAWNNEFANRRKELWKKLNVQAGNSTIPVAYEKTLEKIAAQEDNRKLLEHLRETFDTIVVPETKLFGEIIELLMICAAFRQDGELSSVDAVNAIESIANRYKNYLGQDKGIQQIKEDPFVREKSPIDPEQRLEQFRQRTQNAVVKLQELSNVKIAGPVDMEKLKELEGEVSRLCQAAEEQKKTAESSEARRQEAGFDQQYPRYWDQRAKLAYVNLLFALREELDGLAEKNGEWSDSELVELADRLRKKIDGFETLNYRFVMRPWDEETGVWFLRDSYNQDALFLTAEDKTICVVRGKVNQISEEG